MKIGPKPRIALHHYQGKGKEGKVYDGMDTFVTLNLSRSRRRPALLPVEGVEGWMVVVDDEARGLM